MRRDPIRSAAVVIPAHDEEEVLAACLDSVLEACAGLRVPTEVVVVVDSCRDGSAAICRLAGVTTVTVGTGDVGRARRAGMARVLAGVDRSMVPRLWLASSDADSVVPPDWLTHQVELADRGMDAHLGTISLAEDGPGLTVATRRRFEAGYRAWTTSGAEHPHVHGANLGVRASAYAEVGGFFPGPAHEDRHLVTRLDRAPAVTVARTDEAPVRTSARTIGRAPVGLATDLHHLGLHHPDVRHPEHEPVGGR